MTIIRKEIDMGLNPKDLNLYLKHVANQNCNLFSPCQVTSFALQWKGNSKEEKKSAAKNSAASG